METTKQFYCHDCVAWCDCELLDDGTYECVVCASIILCDGCGQEYTDDHDEEH